MVGIFHNHSLQKIYKQRYWHFLGNKICVMWPNIFDVNPTYKVGQPNRYEIDIKNMFESPKDDDISIWPNIFDINPDIKLGNPSDYEPKFKITLDNQIAYNIENGPNYIFCLPMGALDDLIIPTFWEMQNNLSEDFTYVFNEKPWNYTIKLNNATHYNSFNIFEQFEFVNTNYKKLNPNFIGLLVTEKYPDLLSNPLVNAIITVLDIEEEHMLEIITRKVYRMITSNEITPFYMSLFKKYYMLENGKELTDMKEIDKKTIDASIIEAIPMFYNHIAKPYINSSKNLKNYNNVFVFKYEDFFTKSKNSYLALDKLKDITKCPITQEVYDKYNVEIEKRNSFIKNIPICKNEN